MKTVHVKMKKAILRQLGEKRNEVINNILRQRLPIIDVEGEKKVDVKIALHDDVYAELEKVSKQYGIPITRIIEYVVQSSSCVDVVEKFYGEFRAAIRERRVFQANSSEEIPDYMLKSALKHGAIIRIKTKTFSPADIEELERRGIVSNCIIDTQSSIVFTPGPQFDVGKVL